jgi:hypothetical protein
VFSLDMAADKAVQRLGYFAVPAADGMTNQTNAGLH